MRVLGWLLLVGGLLLCASILWAAPGFLCMGLGLIFLQIAEEKDAALNRPLRIPINPSLKLSQLQFQE